MGDGVNIAARLEGIAKPGAICLSEDAYRQVKGRLDLAVTDLGPTQLKNIAEPIRVYSLDVGAPAHAKPAPAAAPEISAPARLSLVVLPFANIGGDPEQDYFVDGVTESLTTDLSRISGSFVIGRNTAFTFKGKHVDLKQVGRDLNVRYVLEGSVQRAGNRMRVNVQLIEAETGAHLWAERFDKLVADFFDMQDEIVSRLANRLGHELAVAEARRAERAINPDSMDHYFLGQAHLKKGITAEHQHKARSHFDRALDLDPDNVGALVMRAWVDLTVAIHLRSENRPERFRSAEADLGKALRLRPETADAHVALGLLRLQTNRADQGIAECERGLAIDRNHPHAHALIGVGKNLTGRSDETEAHVLEALRISPHDRRAGMWLMIAATAKLWAGHDEEAVAGSVGRSSWTRTSRCVTSTLQLLRRFLSVWRKRAKRRAWGLNSIRASPSRGTAPQGPATIPSFSRAASAFTKACVWPEFRKDDRRPPTRRDPRRRCRRLLAPDGRGRGRDGAAYAHADKMDEAKAASAEARHRNPATHGQMDDRTHEEPDGRARGPAQGGLAGGMKQV